MEWLTAAVTENPVFQGGFGLAAIGLAVQSARRSAGTLSVIARRKLLMSVEVTSKDPSWHWVLPYLNSQCSSNHISVDCTGAGKVTLVPGPGRHIMQYAGKYILIERQREPGSLDFTSGRPWESLKLTAFGKDTSVFQRLLDEAYEASVARMSDSTVILTNWGSEWRPFGHPRPRRPIDSVILDEGVAERVLEDIAEWRRSKDWYLQRGIPYRRGYMLYGTPGSGKSSFICAIAGHLGYNIAMLNLNESGLTDDRLALAMTTVPPETIVVLEDVDAAFSESSTISFSGLLNTLDGVVASEERLVFMTTNYVELLDPALIRPGRVDLIEEVAHPSSSQRRRLFERFFPEARILAETFDANLGDDKISMAQLQGYLLSYKDDPCGAVENAGSAQSRGRESLGNVSPTSKPDSSKRPGPRKRLGALDVDRVMFNPQSGWDSL